MANKIILKKSSVASKVPLATDLEIGELSVNLTDQKLYTKNAAGTVVLVGSAVASGGDVNGPASATDNALVRYDGTTGKLIQNSVVTLDDTGNQSGLLSQQFSDGTAVTVAAGKQWFNATTGSWNLGMGGGNITQQVGEELFVFGKASAAIADSPLQIIQQTGVVGASSAITFAPTTSGIADGSKIIGVATESIALNGFGRVTSLGVVRGITTDGVAYGETWASGDTIWYNPVTGNPTKVKPVAPNIKVSVGTIIVAGTGGSGSIQVEINHGSVLGGTDSNVQLNTLATNNLLQYNGTYWTNVANIPNSNLANSSITINGSPISLGGTVSVGTVTSVGGTGTVSGLTLSGTVTSTGNLTLGGTLAVTPSNFSSQLANTVLAAPNGAAGVPTFRSLVAADIPTLNQNTTGTASNVTGTVAIANGGTGQTTRQNAMDALAGAVTSGQYLRGNGTDVVMSAIQAADVPTLNQNTTGTASNVTGTVAIANGGTGATTAAAARTNLGGTTVGSNLFTLTNPTAITFLRVNADNTVSALDAATFRTAIGAGTSSTTGTVTSITAGTGLSGGTITTTGTISLANTTVVAGSYTNANITVDAQGRITTAANGAAGGVTSFSGGTTGLTPSTATTGAITLAGTLAIANGGTGSTTAAGALTALGAYPATNPNGYTSNTGTVTGVTATAPVVSSGGTAPVISMAAATASVNGYMTSTYAAKLDGIAAGATANTGTVTSVSGTGTVSGLTLTGTVTTSGSLTLGGTLSLTSGNVTTALGYTPVASYADGCVIENGQTISTNYTMTSGKNGMSAGPITIATGITVTIPTGSNWVIV